MRKQVILKEKALPMGGSPAHGQKEAGKAGVQYPASPCQAAELPRQDPAHLDGLVRGATEEQVPHGVDAETPDRTLVAHEGSFALEDLLRVIGCRQEELVRDLGGPW